MKISLRRIPLNQGGYDSRGKYYGVGPPLYRITVDGDDSGDIRAYHNFETKEKIIERVKIAIRNGLALR